MAGHSSRIGLGRVRTSALEAVVYLCSMHRNVRLMRGCVTPGSLGTSCLKFFCVFPAMISRLPCGNVFSKYHGSILPLEAGTGALHSD